MKKLLKKAKSGIGSVANTAQDGVTRGLDATIDAVSDAAETVQETVAEGYDVTVDSLTTASRSVLNFSEEQIDTVVNFSESKMQRVLDAMFPRCPIRVYVMPTSDSAKDFLIFVDLSPVFAQWDKGNIVRPEFSIVCSRNDHPWDDVYAELRRILAIEMEAHKESLQKAAEAEITRHKQDELEELSRSLVDRLEKNAAIAILSLFPAITTPIMLYLAFTSPMLIVDLLRFPFSGLSAVGEVISDSWTKRKTDSTTVERETKLNKAAEDFERFTHLKMQRYVRLLGGNSYGVKALSVLDEVLPIELEHKINASILESADKKVSA